MSHELSSKNNSSKQVITAALIVGLAWSAFQIYLAVKGPMHPILQRPIHVVFAIILCLFSYPVGKKISRGKSKFIDILLVAITATIGIYLIVNFPRLSIRVAYADPVTAADTVLAILLVVMVLEATRRIVGYSLTLLTVVFIAYAFFGPYMPGALAHRGVTLRQFVELMFLSVDGIFGLPTGVSVDNIFYFILFGAFLEITGAGQMFIDLAVRLSGTKRGAPARTTVIGSALLGTMSGSAVANVTTVGVFTIPMMKKVGYRPVIAGAIEAASSTGGQIMPPIMGAGAFVMAELLGVQYAKVALAAIIPAVLFYLSILISVTLFAMADQVGDSGELMSDETKRTLWKRIHLVIPLVVLVYYIANQSSLMTAAFRSTLAAILVSFLRKETRMSLKSFVGALVKGARSATVVAVPCATAGIIVGIVVMTGLGLKFSGVIQSVSGGNLFIALMITMVGCIIMGMGMPTTSAYIMGAILFAPPLIDMGLQPIAAHMFIFYFGILSMVTPPVALAAYAASGIAESDMSKTGWKALQISLAAFLVPYGFAFNQALLGIGPIAEVVWVVITAGLGVLALSAMVTGFFIRKAFLIERILLGVAAVLLIMPEKFTDLIGVLILISVFLWQWKVQPKADAVSTSALNN